MILRLTMVTGLIALFALSFGALVGSAHQRSVASPVAAGDGCLAGRLLCANGGGDLRG